MGGAQTQAGDLTVNFLPVMRTFDPFSALSKTVSKTFRLLTLCSRVFKQKLPSHPFPGGRGVNINRHIIVTHLMICCFIEKYTDVIESD